MADITTKYNGAQKSIIDLYQEISYSTDNVNWTSLIPDRGGEVGREAGSLLDGKFTINSSSVTYYNGGLNNASKVVYEEPNLQRDGNKKTYPLSGWNPSQNTCLWSSGSEGTYTITRYDSYIDFNGTIKYFKPHSPMRLFFFLQGAGGSGGSAQVISLPTGTTCYSGLGGGAGGTASGVIQFNSNTISITLSNSSNSTISTGGSTVTCGKGGSANSWISQGSDGVAKLDAKNLSGGGQTEPNKFIDVTGCTNGAETYYVYPVKYYTTTTLSNSYAGYGNRAPCGTSSALHAGGSAGVIKSWTLNTDGINGSNGVYGSGGGGGGWHNILSSYTPGRGGDGGSSAVWLYY